MLADEILCSKLNKIKVSVPHFLYELDDLKVFFKTLLKIDKIKKINKLDADTVISEKCL